MRFRKISNIALIAVTATFLAFPAAATAMHGVGIEFPEWMGVGRENSVVEARPYTAMPEASSDNIASGAFQTQAEKYFADIIPMRDDVLIANAAMQRTCIEIANSPKGYDCYPTYFNSKTIYSPRINALSYLPAHLSSETISAACSSLEGLRKLASDYPNTKFVVCLVQGGQNAAVNPGYKYMPNSTTGDDVAKKFAESINDSTDNLFMITTEYQTEGEYYADFYRTDHHWNSRGAITAYNRIADIVQIPRFDNPEIKDFGDANFIGTTSRIGIYLKDEFPFDLGGSGEGLTIVSPDGSESQYKHPDWPYERQRRRWEFHNRYYEFIKDGSSIHNENAHGSAMLLCDSYGADLVPLLGANYNTISYVRDLHNSAKTDSNTQLRSKLEQQHYDLVCIVGYCTGFFNLAKRSPSYFK